MQAPYNVLDVAHYIIKYSHEHSYEITNLKLQKLLYFVQALFLIRSNGTIPCFSQDIEAWPFGPVVPEAYQEYKIYGSLEIPYSKTKHVLNKSLELKSYVYNENIISEDDKSKINEVIEHFKDTSAYELANLTHNQAPWKNAFIPYCNQVISCESITNFFLNEQQKRR
jgi:uncharacterized phage-associated protein